MASKSLEYPWGPWPLGMDTLSPADALPKGAVRDALNGEFDRAGRFRSIRLGARVLEQANLHSLWTAPTLGVSLCMADYDLCRARFDGATLALSPLATLSTNARIDYCELNGAVIGGNADGLFIIRPDAVTPLGVETPAYCPATAVDSGGLDAGRYGVGIVYLSGHEESGLSALTFVDAPQGGGLELTPPQPTSAAVTAIRVYRTPPNGDQLYRCADLPLGLPRYRVGVAQLGRQCETQYLERLPGGRFVRAWRGRLLTARGETLYYSEPLRYGLYSPRTGFVSFPSRISLLEPVEGGVFVGDAHGVRFLAGDRPAEWKLTAPAGFPPAVGSGVALPASYLAPDLAANLGVTGQMLALWLSGNGFVLGLPDGRVVELTRDRLSISVSGDGACVLHDRRALVVLSTSH